MIICIEYELFNFKEETIRGKKRTTRRGITTAKSDSKSQISDEPVASLARKRSTDFFPKGPWPWCFKYHSSAIFKTDSLPLQPLSSWSTPNCHHLLQYEPLAKRMEHSKQPQIPLPSVPCQNQHLVTWSMCTRRYPARWEQTAGLDWFKLRFLFCYFSRSCINFVPTSPGDF